MTFSRLLALIWCSVTAILVALAMIDSLNETTFFIGLSVLVIVSVAGVSDNDDDFIDHALDIQCPELMRVGEKQRVSARTIGDTFHTATNLPHALRVDIRVDEHDFRIIKLSTTEQSVSASQSTVWDFDITPIQKGKKSIRFLATELGLASHSSTRDLPPIDEQVTVVSNPMFQLLEFWKRNWKWLVTTLGIPLYGWLAVQAGSLDFGGILAGL